MRLQHFKNLLKKRLSSFLENTKQIPSLQNVVEEWMNGILILTPDKELIYINNSAHRLLQQINPGISPVSFIPEEIWHICHSMIESRSLFPHQDWLMEAQVFSDSSFAFHIQAQWIQLEAVEEPCLLLIVTEQYQHLKNIAVTEAQQYGLTSREKEIWLLYRAKYSYKQIAAELCITPNTVKKHMKSIHAKRKCTL